MERSINAASITLRFAERLMAALLCFICVLESGSPAYARDVPASTTIDFNIPAQPLASALDAYGTATGLDVFYDSTLVAGLHSLAVRGVLSPEVALRGLLAGTGLMPRSTGPRSFMLVSSSSIRLASTTDQAYFAMLQKELSRALCGRAEIRPRDVDLLLKVWIMQSGAIGRAQLFDMVTGAPGSASVDGILHGLSLEAPPAGMPQPVSIVILAPPPGAPARCGHAAAGAR
ncbi:hypothetical protein E0H22_14295 [Rhodopseudomonas boonkerdii]|uniref:STN domain-containing protein n=1 Tax=Rhodopseudomonas boonkerdii TaxID=475937 RepID=UPI001E3F6865|nr:STN domain-containing protein [Rhodopseudomonas boonkerdii]UGV26746.1 hypothetical protein E0H22_14295 [Rhodopseudomonas boonkerdii]